MPGTARITNSERIRRTFDWVETQMGREFLKRTRWVGPLHFAPLLLILLLCPKEALDSNYVRFSAIAVGFFSFLRTVLIFFISRASQSTDRGLIQILSTLAFATAMAWGNLAAAHCIVLGISDPHTTLVLVCGAAIGATATTAMAGNLIGLLLFQVGLAVCSITPLLFRTEAPYWVLAGLIAVYSAIMSYQGYFQNKVLRQSLVNRFMAMEEVNRSQVFMNTVPGYVAIFSADSKIVSVNHNMQSQIIGKSWHNLPVGEVFPGSTLASAVQSFLWSSRDTTSTEIQLGPEFGNRWHLITFRRLNFPMNGAILLSLDIDESRKNREELEHERVVNQAAARLASLGEMAGGIAHEINNPLTVIIGRAQQIQNWLDEGRIDPAKIRTFAESIRQTGNRISLIIKGLRAFARDSEKDPVIRAKVCDILDDTLSFCQARIQGHGIDLRLPENVDERWTVDCRPVQIGQILLNLLNNAHDATETLDDRWIQVDLKVTEDEMHLSVTDSGKGIPRAIQEKIMEPFFTTKDTNRGTGLGLSIAKGIVEAHNGQLLIDNQCENTRFIVVLPRYRTDTKLERDAA
ncbi:MAG: HAMP domain-containing histidine kinase [Bdellovibrionales bacterium]|nr:HAMP domain-containing histidine kinase [Bdellovibrionales bacterium]